MWGGRNRHTPPVSEWRVFFCVELSISSAPMIMATNWDQPKKATEKKKRAKAKCRGLAAFIILSPYLGMFTSSCSGGGGGGGEGWGDAHGGLEPLSSAPAQPCSLVCGSFSCEYPSCNSVVYRGSSVVFRCCSVPFHPILPLIFGTIRLFGTSGLFEIPRFYDD